MQMEMQNRIERGRGYVNADATAQIAVLCGMFRQKGFAISVVATISMSDCAGLLSADPR